MTMIIGKIHNAIKSYPDKDNVANNPTRAERAVDKIIAIIGVAHTKPIKQATELIFAIIICI